MFLCDRNGSTRSHVRAERIQDVEADVAAQRKTLTTEDVRNRLGWPGPRDRGVRSEGDVSFTVNDFS